MKDNEYKKQLASFIAEIIEADIDEFKNPKKWTLSKEVLNGVLIGYELPRKSSRLLLHEIGQKHNLIPLCPDDLVDIKMSKEYKPEGAIVKSRWGEFSINAKNK